MKKTFVMFLCLICVCLPAFSDSDVLPLKKSAQSVDALDKMPHESAMGVSWGVTVVALMLSGFLFMFLEIAVIPGFGITGILGIIFLVGGIVAAYMKLSTAMALAATLAGIFGVVVLLLWFFLIFPKTRLGKNFILQTDSSVEDGYVAVEDFQRYLGKEGIALTMLRPSGIARIEGERIDVITDGEFVEKGIPVKVIKTGAGKIVVTPVTPQD